MGDGRKLVDLNYTYIVFVSEGTDDMRGVLECLVEDITEDGLVIYCSRT